MVKPIVPRQQHVAIKHFDRTVDILARVSVATDGTMVLVRPGKNEPFDYEDRPYEDVAFNEVLYVVPNRTEEVGKDSPLTPSAAIPPASPAPPAAVPVAFVGYPKVMRDPSTVPQRPDVTVNNPGEESDARSRGYVEEVAPVLA